MVLYHFSENPAITVFRPHIAKTSAIQEEALVWAIDEWHSPMYYVPRDCPRACFWAGPTTTREDRERWMNHLDPRFVMVVEATWLERIRTVQLYRYSMPAAPFSPALHGGGHYVSREEVNPLEVQPVGDLLMAIIDAGVELRITPRLGPMWKQICSASTLAYSGTRLRNALGYPVEFGVPDEAPT
jgi:hypothetical protein